MTVICNLDVDSTNINAFVLGLVVLEIIMGYLGILNPVILVPKGQGCPQSLTFDILAITESF